MTTEEIKALPYLGSQLCPKAPTVGAVARFNRGRHLCLQIKSTKLPDGTYLSLCECKFCGEHFREEHAPTGF